MNLTEAGAYKLEIANEVLWLLPEAAVFWPQQKTLFIADTHFGKDASFRRSGITVPVGTDHEDLQRISQLLQQTDARKLIILGDFVHATPAKNDLFPELLAAWKRQHSALELQVVCGNHDKYSTAFFKQELQWIAGETQLFPFVLCHEPPDEKLPGLALAGHIHPVLHLRTRADTIRLPVFWLRTDYLVLPAFGGFTGGYPIELSSDDQAFGITPEAVIALTGAGIS